MAPVEAVVMGVLGMADNFLDLEEARGGYVDMELVVDHVVPRIVGAAAAVVVVAQHQWESRQRASIHLGVEIAACGRDMLAAGRL